MTGHAGVGAVQLYKLHSASSFLVTGVDSPGNVLQGHYRYMDNLLAPEATATGQGPKCFRPATSLKVPLPRNQP